MAFLSHNRVTFLDICSIKIKNRTLLDNIYTIAYDTLENMREHTTIENYSMYGITEEEFNAPTLVKFEKGLPYWIPNFDGDIDTKLRDKLMSQAKDYLHAGWYIMTHACTNYSMTNYLILLDAYPEERWYIYHIEDKGESHTFIANSKNNWGETEIKDALTLLNNGKTEDMDKKYGGLIIVDPCDYLLSDLDYVVSMEWSVWSLYTFLRHKRAWL